MGKMIFEFPDLTADSISALHIYSRPAPRKPRTVTATSRAVNFEILNPPDAVDDNNCYAFTWVGKKVSDEEVKQPHLQGAVFLPMESKSWNATKNFY